MTRWCDLLDRVILSTSTGYLSTLSLLTPYPLFPRRCRCCRARCRVRSRIYTFPSLSPLLFSLSHQSLFPNTMLTSALLPLLPLLGAGLTTALPPHQHHTTTPSTRLSLSFGPSHPHKTFSVVNHDVDAAVEFDGDWKRVVANFLKAELGDEWFIRDDVSDPFPCSRSFNKRPPLTLRSPTPTPTLASPTSMFDSSFTDSK